MIAQKIIELRKQKQLTQTDMAEHLSISRQAYSFYETGKHEMDFKSLCKLADFFGVSTDYLLGRYDTKPFLLDKDDEIVLVKKYRELDERGRSSVQVVLEHEYLLNKLGAKNSAV
jgi:transcriptional regulator with XRE-family HTH domain